MCWHLLYNYEVKLTGLTEVVGLFIFSKIGSGDKIVCVKLSSVLESEEWSTLVGDICVIMDHLHHSLTWLHDTFLKKNVYLKMNVQTDQTPTDRQLLCLWDKPGSDFSNLSQGN